MIAKQSVDKIMNLATLPPRQVPLSSIVRGHIFSFNSVVEMNLIVHSEVGKCEQMYFVQRVLKTHLPPKDCSTWYFVTAKWGEKRLLANAERQVAYVHTCVAHVLEKHVLMYPFFDDID